jgi:hypothetical protein
MKIGNQNKSWSMLSSVSITVLIIIAALVVSIVVPSQQQQQEQQVLAQQQQQQEPGSILKLSRASIPIDIPLSKGYIDDNIAYFIATDASDKKVVSSITIQEAYPQVQAIVSGAGILRIFAASE